MKPGLARLTISAFLVWIEAPGAAANPCRSLPERKAASVQWLRIPGGTFMMGDGADKRRASVGAFEMAKSEVTFAQYCACVAAGACTPPGEPGRGFLGENNPVVNVDWEQAKAYAQWAGGRLPSEAEWEYAARGGGKDLRYPWGQEKATCARAVLDDASAGGAGCGRGSTWPVCSKPAGHTRHGLCDMAGNVFEWTSDRYRDSEDLERVARGGSWVGGPTDTAAAFRANIDPSSRYDILGLRPVRGSSKGEPRSGKR